MPSEVLVCLEPSWEVGGTESPDLGHNARGPGQNLSPMDPCPDLPSPVLLIVEAIGIVIGDHPEAVFKGRTHCAFAMTH